MGIYAALGVGQAVAAFLMGAAFALLTYFASQRLHKVGDNPHKYQSYPLNILCQGSIKRVMHAPMSFFETTVSCAKPYQFISLHLLTPIFCSHWGAL